MRITDNQIYSSIKNSMRKSLMDYYKANEPVTTGKRINRPSDDPEGAGRVIRYRGEIESFENYQKNIQHGNFFMNQVEISMGISSEILVSVKEIALSAANSSNNSSQFEILAHQVNALKEQLISQANASLDGKYLFSGYDMSTLPYDSSGVYQGDSGEVQIRINENDTVVLNTPGEQVFGAAGGGVDIFQALNDLETAVRNNDLATIQAGIDNMDRALEQVNLVRAKSGLKINQLDTANLTMDLQTIDLKTLISNTEDADISEAFMDFTRQEFVLQSVMASSARLLQTNLLSFLD